MCQPGFPIKGEITGSYIRRRVQIFFFWSLLGLIVLFLLTSSSETFSALGRLRWGYLLLALGLACLDWMLGGGRVYVLTNVLSPISYPASVQASMANLCVGAITPSQSGGGPAHVFVLHRNGLSLPKAIASAVVTFMMTVTVLLLFAIWITIAGAEAAVGVHLQPFFRLGALAFVGVSLVFVLFLVRPKAMVRITETFIKGVGFLIRRELHTQPAIRRFLEIIEECRESFVLYWHRGKFALFFALVITIVLFFNKFTIAWVVVRGLGLQAMFGQVLLIQALLTLITYFAPSPGSSGIAELVSAALMSRIVPRTLLPIYTVLWRFFTMYVGVIVGGVLLLRYLRPAEPH